MSAARTVRVRIAVATWSDGEWTSARAYAGGSDEAALKRLYAGEGHRVSWVEADVPLPEPPAVVEGEVSP